MMKKLLLGCIALTAVFFTQAQKDISVSLVSNTSGGTVQAGVPFDVTFSVTNAGTVDLVAEDSVWFAMTVAGNNIAGNNIFLAARTSAVVAPGASWDYTVQNINFANIQGGGAQDFCITVVLYEDTASTPSTDPTPANNTSCTSLDFVEGTNSVETIYSLQTSTVTAIPNPASDLVTFEVNGGNAESVVIMNLSGQVVAEEAFNGASATINVSDLKEGIYLYAVHTTNGVLATQKLAIK